MQWLIVVGCRPAKQKPHTAAVADADATTEPVSATPSAMAEAPPSLTASPAAATQQRRQTSSHDQPDTTAVSPGQPPQEAVQQALPWPSLDGGIPSEDGGMTTCTSSTPTLPKILPSTTSPDTGATALPVETRSEDAAEEPSPQRDQDSCCDSEGPVLSDPSTPAAEPSGDHDAAVSTASQPLQQQEPDAYVQHLLASEVGNAPSDAGDSGSHAPPDYPALATEHVAESEGSEEGDVNNDASVSEDATLHPQSPPRQLLQQDISGSEADLNSEADSYVSQRRTESSFKATTQPPDNGLGQEPSQAFQALEASGDGFDSVPTAPEVGHEDMWQTSDGGRSSPQPLQVSTCATAVY